LTALIHRAISHLPRIHRRWETSLPWVRKDLLASGKESLTLRGVPAQGESPLACSAAAAQGELTLGPS